MEGEYKNRKFVHIMSDGKAFNVWYDEYQENGRFVTYLRGHEELHLTLEELEKLKKALAEK